MKKKCPVKVRVDIEEDARYKEAGLGKRYKVTKWVFERKTGRTLEMSSYGTNYTLKAAREAKKQIMDAYYS